MFPDLHTSLGWRAVTRQWALGGAIKCDSQPAKESAADITQSSCHDNNQRSWLLNKLNDSLRAVPNESAENRLIYISIADVI